MLLQSPNGVCCKLSTDDYTSTNYKGFPACTGFRFVAHARGTKPEVQIRRVDAQMNRDEARAAVIEQLRGRGVGGKDGASLEPTEEHGVIWKIPRDVTKAELSKKLDQLPCTMPAVKLRRGARGCEARRMVHVRDQRARTALVVTNELTSASRASLVRRTPSYADRSLNSRCSSIVENRPFSSFWTLPIAITGSCVKNNRPPRFSRSLRSEAFSSINSSGNRS